jgi:hypothetical protein
MRFARKAFAWLVLFFVVAVPGLGLCAEPGALFMVPIAPRPLVMGSGATASTGFGLFSVNAPTTGQAAGAGRAQVVSGKPSEIFKSLPNTDMFLYVLDSKLAASVGLAFMSASYGENSSYIVQEFSIYRDAETAQENSTMTQRIGVSVRLIIQVNERAAKLSTLGLPQIAFGVEKKDLKATVRMQVIGIQGPGITNAFELPSELNFTTLSGLYKAVDEVKKQAWSDTTQITPQVLAESRRL